MAELAGITAKAQTANEDMLDAIGRAFPMIDEPLKRIALLNSMLAGARSLHLEGAGFDGFEEMLYDIEDCLAHAVHALNPAFCQWQVRRDRAVTGAD